MEPKYLFLTFIHSLKLKVPLISESVHFLSIYLETIYSYLELPILTKKGQRNGEDSIGMHGKQEQKKKWKHCCAKLGCDLNLHCLRRGVMTWLTLFTLCTRWAAALWPACVRPSTAARWQACTRAPTGLHTRAPVCPHARHAACSVRFVRLRNLWIAIIVVAQKSRGDLVQNFLPLNNEKLTQWLYSIKGLVFRYVVTLRQLWIYT